MSKIITVGDITYTLEYKNVKNINLRIRPDGTVHVSANRYVPQNVIDDFVSSKAGFILNAQDRLRNCAFQKEYYSQSEIREVIISICKEVYPYFEKCGIDYPQVKFRRMVSRWGSCHPTKGILTFNINLMYAPYECIKYVVFHEFTHFLVPNHSHDFYAELEKVCPDWKIYRKKLRAINITSP